MKYKEIIFLCVGAYLAYSGHPEPILLVIAGILGAWHVEKVKAELLEESKRSSKFWNDNLQENVGILRDQFSNLQKELAESNKFVQEAKRFMSQQAVASAFVRPQRIRSTDAEKA